MFFLKPESNKIALKLSLHAKPSKKPGPETTFEEALQDIYLFGHLPINIDHLGRSADRKQQATEDCCY